MLLKLCLILAKMITKQQILCLSYATAAQQVDVLCEYGHGIWMNGIFINIISVAWYYNIRYNIRCTNDYKIVCNPRTLPTILEFYA